MDRNCAIFNFRTGSRGTELVSCEFSPKDGICRRDEVSYLLRVRSVYRRGRKVVHKGRGEACVDVGGPCGRYRVEMGVAIVQGVQEYVKKGYLA